MKTASCRCGTVWVQRGNRTGHCSACHETFEGIGAFDTHQRMLDGPPWQVCKDPVTMRGSDGHPIYEAAHETIQGFAYTWRLRVDPEARERLQRLRNHGLADPPEGDGTGQTSPTSQNATEGQ